MLLANITVFLLGIFTLSKNIRSATNILFAVLCSALIGWTTANYFSLYLTDPEEIFLSIRFVFLFVVLQNTAFFLFVNIFPSAKSTLNPAKVKVFLLLSFVVGAIAFTGLVFKGYSYQNEQLSLLASPLIAAFIAHAAFSIGWGIKSLISRYKRSSDVLRNQLLFLITASVILLVVVPLTNFVLPIAFKNSTFVAFSPIYTAFFAFIIAYAVIRQKLFDIRLVVARSVAYILVVATLGLLGSLLFFTASELVFGEAIRRGSAGQALNVLLAVLLALSFQPLKRFFDKVTNRLFYRDAYDSQAVLNNVNTLLTQEIDLKVITHKGLTIICQSLRIDRGYFVVMDDGKVYDTAFYGNVKGHEIPVAELASFNELLVADEYSSGKAAEVLKKYDYSIGLKLATQDEVVGFIFLSLKQSGNIYTQQDIRLLSIIGPEMAIGVQNARAFQEISQFNITLQKRIEEATRELQTANTRLKELDKAKDEFISMASHQLRTPLTAIKGYLSMVLEGDVGPVQANEKPMLKRAFDSAQKMVYLIGDMLNVSRIQSGKFIIENKPTNLAEVAEGEIAQLSETAQNRKVKLIYNKPASFPTLMLDENKIRQVIMNFVDNAVYYTPAGGTVTAEVHETPTTVDFTVKDTGVGVPKEVQSHLFAKFYRASNARKIRPDGTGLGLFTAKKVIDAQGGTILFQSEEGKGSTFGFRFSKPVKVQSVSTPVKR